MKINKINLSDIIVCLIDNFGYGTIAWQDFDNKKELIDSLTKEQIELVEREIEN